MLGCKGVIRGEVWGDGRAGVIYQGSFGRHIVVLVGWREGISPPRIVAIFDMGSWAVKRCGG